MCSVYNAIAGLRWPNYRVKGSGPLAVVCISQQEVYLHEMPMAANLEAAQSCWCCDSLFKRKNVRHKLVDLSATARRSHFRRNSSLARAMQFA
jgi:hypothetical protein